MLQDRDGHIRPEGYIRDWLNKMANPEVVTSESVTLSVGGDWKTPIKDENLEEASSYLLNAGLADHVKCLTDFRKARFSFDALDEMLALEHFASNVSPWKIFKMRPENDSHDASLGYVPPEAKGADLLPSEVPSGVRLDRENYALRVDGKIKPCGWAFSIVEKFVKNEPDRVGLFNPLASLKRIKLYRFSLGELDMLDATDWIIAHIPRSGLADWEKTDWAPESLDEKFSDPSVAKLVEDRGEEIVVQVLGSKAGGFLPDTAEIKGTVFLLGESISSSDQDENMSRSRPRVAHG